MKVQRRLNKIGEITLISFLAFLVLIILLIGLMRSRKKHEIHILKNTDQYQLKINYPLIHDKKIDREIKNYVEQEKEKFLNEVRKTNNIEKDNKYDFILQYHLSKDQTVYHIHLETYSYTGGNEYLKDDKTFHYDMKQKQFLTIKDYLNHVSDLEKLSLLSYYYIMEYAKNVGKELNESLVKENVSSKAENFIHFNVKEEGFEFLFPLYKNKTWEEGEIKVTIPYQELNELLKPKYQREIVKNSIKVTPPEKRDLKQFLGKKLIAFTFDDGPSMKTTSYLLDGVKKFDAKITFFVLGNRVAQNKNILKRAYEEGHVIGSHTYNHRNLLLLDDYSRMQEIRETNQLIESIIGVKPTLLRPPYGNINQDIKKISNMHIIEWNIDTLDWKYNDKNYIANEIVSQAHDGAIVLLHDIYDASVEGALQAMDILQQQGYAFVTILEMAELKNITLDYTTSYRYFK